MFLKEKFDRSANAIAAGRVAGIDALEQITKRSIRIVDTLHAEVGVCVLCRFAFNAFLIEWVVFIFWVVEWLVPNIIITGSPYHEV